MRQHCTRASSVVADPPRSAVRSPSPSAASTASLDRGRPRTRARGRGAAASPRTGSWRAGWRCPGRRCRARSRGRARTGPGPSPPRLALGSRPIEPVRITVAAAGWRRRPAPGHGAGRAMRAWLSWVRFRLGDGEAGRLPPAGAAIQYVTLGSVKLDGRRGCAPAREGTGMPWWAWMVLGIGLLGVEMFVIDAQFYLVFIGLSAAIVGLLGLVGVEFPDWSQWLVFAVLALVAMVAFRRRVYETAARLGRPRRRAPDRRRSRRRGRAAGARPDRPGRLPRFELERPQHRRDQRSSRVARPSSRRSMD